MNDNFLDKYVTSDKYFRNNLEICDLTNMRIENSHILKGVIFLIASQNSNSIWKNYKTTRPETLNYAINSILEGIYVPEIIIISYNGEDYQPEIYEDYRTKTLEDDITEIIWLEQDTPLSQMRHLHEMIKYVNEFDTIPDYVVLFDDDDLLSPQFLINNINYLDNINFKIKNLDTNDLNTNDLNINMNKIHEAYNKLDIEHISNIIGIEIYPLHIPGDAIMFDGNAKTYISAIEDEYEARLNGRCPYGAMDYPGTICPYYLLNIVFNKLLEITPNFIDDPEGDVSLSIELGNYDFCYPYDIDLFIPWVMMRDDDV